MASDNQDKQKNTKKDKLSSALKKEVEKSGLSGFIRDIKKNNKKNQKPEEKISSLPNEMDTSEYSSDNYSLEKPKIGIKTKNVMFTIAGLLLLIYLYNIFLGENLYQKAVYLSAQPISTSKLASLRSDLPVFAMGKPIYVHFSMGSPLKLDNIRIQIVHLVSDIEHTIGEISATTKPEWEHVQTHFQEEFFDKRGEYKIKIFTANNELLSDQLFKIR